MAGGELIPLGFMRPGQAGTLAEIRSLRHHPDDAGGAGRAGRSIGHGRGRMFHTGRGHRLEHRLNHMGLTPGARIKVVQNNAPGPVIVAVRGSRLCLGRSIACRVMVKPESKGNGPAVAGEAGA